MTSPSAASAFAASLHESQRRSTILHHSSPGIDPRFQSSGQCGVRRRRWTHASSWQEGPRIQEPIYSALILSTIPNFSERVYHKLRSGYVLATLCTTAVLIRPQSRFRFPNIKSLNTITNTLLILVLNLPRYTVDEPSIAVPGPSKSRPYDLFCSGTSSLRTVLKQLRYNKCHHGFIVPTEKIGPGPQWCHRARRKQHSTPTMTLGEKTSGLHTTRQVHR